MILKVNNLQFIKYCKIFICVCFESNLEVSWRRLVGGDLDIKFRIQDVIGYVFFVFYVVVNIIIMNFLNYRFYFWDGGEYINY